MTEKRNKIELPRVVLIRQLAQLLDQPVTTLLSTLLKEGILATINDSLDYETAAVIAREAGFETQLKETSLEAEGQVGEEEGKDLRERAPVVTVLGHVDHGKTSLLDYLRQTKVAAGEAGGITQKIGAYQVKVKDRLITFLDTPGHEAFSAIRAQGAKVTDLVILVVAADDGVKPQTVESINLAKAAGVPIIVALTKIDKEGADPERVKGELAGFNLVPEDWGGKTVIVPVSSKTGQNIDTLLDLVLLSADLLDLKTFYDGSARAVVIESHHDPQKGINATVVVQRGSLGVGDAFVVGTAFGKVRYLEDYFGRRLKEAFPGMPALLVGLSEAPAVGAVLVEVPSEKEARLLAARRVKASLVSRTKQVRRLNVDELTKQIQLSRSENINLVLKADNAGSLEALLKELARIKASRGKINIIASGIGNINESDLVVAQGAGGLVVGFNVDLTLPAKQMADKGGVKVALYDVIYQLTGDLTNLLLRSIKPEFIEHAVGSGKVLKVFRTEPARKIVGVALEKGKATSGNLARFLREGELVGEGEILSIKQLQAELPEARAKGEFGFSIKIEPKIKENDKVEFIEVEEKKVELEKE